jgi:hypothetical protein
MKDMLRYGYLESIMDENGWRAIGHLEGRFEKIEGLLEVANAQRAEFQSDIRLAVTEMQLMIPMIQNHDKWIESDGKKTAKKVEMAGYFLAGSAVVGTSPAWLGKLAAFLNGIFP